MGKNKTLRTTIYLSDLILNFIESISNNGFVEGKDNDGDQRRVLRPLDCWVIKLESYGGLDNEKQGRGGKLFK